MMSRTTMIRLPAAMAIAGGVLASSMVFAGGPPHAYSVRRQFIVDVVSCMKKRMSADQHLSYNRAVKACKEQVAKQQAGSEASPLVAADGKH